MKWLDKQNADRHSPRFGSSRSPRQKNSHTHLVLLFSSTPFSTSFSKKPFEIPVAEAYIPTTVNFTGEEGAMKNILVSKGVLIIKLVLAIILLWTFPVRPAEIVEYLTPTPDSAPDDLAFDAEGNLWLTEVHGNKIAR